MKISLINYNIINHLRKNLIKGFKSTGGRNFLGRVCTKGKGLCNSSTKKMYRYIDFYRRINKKGLLLNRCYDPNRTGCIGLVLYENGLTSYILLQKNLKIYDIIYSGDIFYENKINRGDSTVLNNIP